MSFDILGTSCDQCRSTVQYWRKGKSYQYILQNNSVIDVESQYQPIQRYCAQHHCLKRGPKKNGLYTAALCQVTTVPVTVTAALHTEVQLPWTKNTPRVFVLNFCRLGLCVNERQ